MVNRTRLKILAETPVCVTMLRHGLIAIHEWHTLSENQVHAMVEWQGALPEKQAIRYRLGGSVLPVFDFRFWGCDPERGVCFLFKVPLTKLFVGGFICP